MQGTVKMGDPTFQAMEDVEEHGDPWHRVCGQSRHGGWSAVMHLIHHKMHWVSHNQSMNTVRAWYLTIEGKAALKEERASRKKA